jgi:hypothetical protein
MCMTGEWPVFLISCTELQISPCTNGCSESNTVTLQKSVHPLVFEIFHTGIMGWLVGAWEGESWKQEASFL